MPESSPHAENPKPLFEAIKEGKIELVRTMLRDDPSLLNAREERGYTPLGAVLRGGKNERVEAMVRMLIDMGAEVDLHAACSLNMPDRVEVLLNEDPARLHEMSPDGWSVMHQVAWRGAVEAAQVLVAHGADVDMKPESPHAAPALHGAVEDGGPAITRFLLDHRADPNAADAYGNTPLHSVVGGDLPREDADECLRLLLEHGADPGRMNHNGHTPLRHALWAGACPAADLLRQSGAPMYRQRPVWTPPGDLVQLVERLMGEAWNRRVTLGPCYQLRGDRVLRFDIASAPDGDAPMPASIVVKQARRSDQNPYDPDTADRPNGAWGLFEDWAGTRLFSSLPNCGEYAIRFYAGDRAAGVIAIEDLGDGEALVDRLMGDDPRRAEEGLVMLAECVGRMHATTIGQQERYRQYRDALGPRPSGKHGGSLGERREALLNGFIAIGIEPAAGFEAEFQQLAAAMEEPGPFLAYVHGDPCPDNCRIRNGRLRLFDFETSGFRHAMVDAVYGRILFPTCWCVNRLPAHIAPMMEAAYRAQLIEGCPEAEDDRRFQQELVHCCAAWLIENGIWLLEEASRDDWRWGISTWRQRVLMRLDALADTTEQLDHLPAMGATARRCTQRLREIWPAEADAMPLYPAFRGTEPQSVT